MKPNISYRLSLFLFVLVLTVLQALSTCLAGQKELILKESQKKASPIIIYAKSADTQKFAAQELKKYLNKMIMWAQPPIQNCFSISEYGDTFGPQDSNTVKIVLASKASVAPWIKQFISPSALPDKNSDSFIIKTFNSNSLGAGQGDTILIAGGSDRALLFGVYDFLERLGCRWFSPKEEHVPKLTELKIGPMDIHESPGMAFRALFNMEPRIPFAACVDWQTKMKLNIGWSPEYLPERGETVHDIPVEMGGGQYRDYTLREAEERMDENGIPEMMQRGLSIGWGQHIVSGSIPLLFPKSYTSTHPEYYALIDGKRLDPDVGYQARQQLCTSNPEVIRILQERAVEFLRHHDWIEFLLIWANDVTQWCECEPCLALEAKPEERSRSATYCRMIRLINEAVQNELPGRKLMISHYYNLEDVPVDKDGKVRTEVLPASANVISLIDVFGQSVRHAFNDPRSTRNGRIKDLIDKWQPYYPDMICYTYYWHGSFMKGMPIGIMRKITEDTKYIRSLGLNGMAPGVGTYSLDDWDFNVLNFYIYGKTMWDPNLDVDATIKDFCKYYYGPAAELMEKFWLLMEQSWSNFGLHPDFMPEDKELAANPKHFHGRWRRSMNIRWLIPNRQVFEKLDKYLHEARYLAAEPYNPPPMKLYNKTYAEYMPYVTRIQLLERFLSLWPTSPWSSAPGEK